VPDVSIADVEVYEGAAEETSEANLTITLSAPRISTINVEWETSEDPER
jgi:hypothetical protein